MISGILIVVFATLALYFFSNMNLYKELYKKIKYEKNNIDSQRTLREEEILQYEKKLKKAIEVIKDTDTALIKSREEVQKMKQINSDLKRRNKLLQDRVDELYSSVGML